MNKIALTYRLSPELLVEGMIAGNRHLNDHMRPNRLIRILTIGALIGVVPFLVIYFGMQTNPDDGHFIALMLGFTLCSIYSLWASSRLREAVVSVMLENDHIRGDIYAEISEDGVEIVSGLGKSFQKWGAFQEVAKLRNGTAFLASGTVLSIPDEALPKGMSADEFRDHVAKWRMAA